MDSQVLSRTHGLRQRLAVQTARCPTSSSSPSLGTSASGNSRTSTVASVSSHTPTTRPWWTTTGEIQPAVRLTVFSRPAGPTGPRRSPRPGLLVEAGQQPRLAERARADEHADLACHHHALGRRRPRSASPRRWCGAPGPAGAGARPGPGRRSRPSTRRLARSPRRPQTQAPAEPVGRALQALAERHVGLPAEPRAGQGDVGPALRRVVDRQRLVDDLGRSTR